MLRRDAVVVLVLLATAFVVELPIFAGGWLTYFDNPAHIAEYHALAGEGASGWTNIAFAGISLDTLHSPVLWHVLSSLSGTSLLGTVYALFTALGLAAPAIAIYLVARRRAAWPWAALLAYVVLIQHSSIVGTASASGGMWPFYLASGAWILLADRLARDSTAPRDRAAIAALLAFIGLVHLYVLEAAVLLVVVHAAWTVATRRDRLRALLGRDAIACLLALAASAIYWLPVAVGAPGFPAPQNLSPELLGKLLVLPTDTIDLLSNRMTTSSLPGYVELVPILALLAAGVAGARHVRRAGDRLPGYGVAVALAVIGALLLADPLQTHALGPNSWRFLYFVRLGAALAAIPWLATLPEPHRRAAVVAAVPIVASGWLWGAPLAADVPADDSAAMTDVRGLWTWLRDHGDGHRVYVQDTFAAPPLDSPLVRSHVLALTLHETGSEPLGAYYGIIPSTTVRYLGSEFGALFGTRIDYQRIPPGAPIHSPLASWNATRLVTSTPEDSAGLARAGWHELARSGRFTVFAEAQPGPLLPMGTRDRSGVLALDVDGDTPLAVAYHAFWTIEDGPPGAHLVQGDHGRLAIVGVPPGAHHVVLAYKPPRVWPISAVGWLGIVAMTLVGARRRQEQT